MSFFTYDVLLHTFFEMLYKREKPSNGTAKKTFVIISSVFDTSGC